MKYFKLFQCQKFLHKHTLGAPGLLVCTRTPLGLFMVEPYRDMIIKSHLRTKHHRTWYTYFFGIIWINKTTKTFPFFFLHMGEVEMMCPWQRFAIKRVRVNFPHWLWCQNDSGCTPPAHGNANKNGRRRRRGAERLGKAANTTLILNTISNNRDE